MPQMDITNQEGDQEAEPKGRVGTEGNQEVEPKG